MKSNETKLQELLSKINKKTESLVNRSIVKTSLNTGLNIIEVAEKHEEKIEEYRKKMLTKLTLEYQDEIDCLKRLIKEENEKPITKVKEKAYP